MAILIHNLSRIWFNIQFFYLYICILRFNMVINNHEYNESAVDEEVAVTWVQ
jgi:hypothetical protein